MFNNISWQGYWIAMALLTILYYLIICLLYYRSNFFAWIQRLQGKISKGTSSTTVSFLGKQEPTRENRPSFFSEETATTIEQEFAGNDTLLINGFSDELDAFLQQAKESRWVKEEILYGLQRLLKKYPTLKETAYKGLLTNLFTERCEQICSIHLRAEEQVRIWEEG